MSQQTHKVSVIIPCHNEADAISLVIKAFPRERLAAQGYELEIIVIDNNSTDDTAKIAKALGATVLHEPKKGKGNAMRAGFRFLSAAMMASAVRCS